MNKTVLPTILLTITLLFTPLYPVYALESNSTRTATESSSAAKREKVIVNKEKVIARVEDHKNVLMDKLDELKAKIASREADFKVKLEKFKDKEKSTIVQRINDNLDKVNKKHTDLMTHRLENMSQILDRFEKKASGSASPSAQLAITNARTAILNAKNAVASQSAKSYIISLTTESKVHDDAKIQRDQLAKDLKTVRQLLVDARAALINVVKVTLGGQGVNK